MNSMVFWSMRVRILLMGSHLGPFRTTGSGIVQKIDDILSREFNNIPLVLKDLRIMFAKFLKHRKLETRNRRAISQVTSDFTSL